MSKIKFLHGFYIHLIEKCIQEIRLIGPGGGGGPGGPGGPGGGVPAPVALEPCAGGRAAVLSLLVRLPTGGTGRAPPLGGLAVASAIVTLGHAPPHHKRPAR